MRRMRSGIAICLMLMAALPAIAGRKKNVASCSAWEDSFSAGASDATRWVIANEIAPGYIPDQHIGYYDRTNTSLDGGLLTLTLNQTTGLVDTNPGGIISHGAMIYTRSKCGYGTYEWRMRMSSTAACADSACYGSPVSGSVSAGFLYVNNSQTEIDFEFSALTPDTLWLVNWLNPRPQLDPTSADETYTAVVPFDSLAGFHTYRMIWAPGRISYYIDGVHFGDHTTNVPTAPAYFMINHWGTDSAGWGGPATVGVVRRLYVTHASYTPPAT